MNKENLATLRDIFVVNNIQDEFKRCLLYKYQQGNIDITKQGQLKNSIRKYDQYDFGKIRIFIKESLFGKDY